MINVETRVIVAVPESEPLPIVPWRMSPAAWQPSMACELIALIARVRELECQITQLKQRHQ